MMWPTKKDFYEDLALVIIVNYAGEKDGGRYRIRTYDLLIKSQLLYQLS